MRFMVADAAGGTCVYRVEGDEAVALSGVVPGVGDDLMSVAGGDAQLMTAISAAAGGERVALSSLRPALPIARPGKIFCLGLNYADHAKEGGHEVPDYPAFFMRGATSLIPAEAPLVRPNCSERLDYEVELLVIVGKGGRHIGQDVALEHVFGYSVFNDGSVRDFQRKSSQWTAGKNFDASGPTGPFVVTPDELPPAAEGLHVETRLNGEVMQSASTSDMLVTVPHAIELLSEFCTLEPGDFIAMGTPQGVGHARTPPVWMKPGDTVEVEVEGIGVCRSPIIAET